MIQIVHWSSTLKCICHEFLWLQPCCVSEDEHLAVCSCLAHVVVCNSRIFENHLSSWYMCCYSGTVYFVALCRTTVLMCFLRPKMCATHTGMFFLWICEGKIYIIDGFSGNPWSSIFIGESSRIFGSLFWSWASVFLQVNCQLEIPPGRDISQSLFSHRSPLLSLVCTFAIFLHQMEQVWHRHVYANYWNR